MSPRRRPLLCCSVLAGCCGRRKLFCGCNPRSGIKRGRRWAAASPIAVERVDAFSAICALMLFPSLHPFYACFPSWRSMRPGSHDPARTGGVSVVRVRSLCPSGSSIPDGLTAVTARTCELICEGLLRGRSRGSQGLGCKLDESRGRVIRPRARIVESRTYGWAGGREPIGLQLAMGFRLPGSVLRCGRALEKVLVTLFPAR